MNEKVGDIEIAPLPWRAASDGMGYFDIRCSGVSYDPDTYEGEDIIATGIDGCHANLMAESANLYKCLKKVRDSICSCCVHRKADVTDCGKMQECFCAEWNEVLSRCEQKPTATKDGDGEDTVGLTGRQLQLCRTCLNEDGNPKCPYYGEPDGCNARQYQSEAQEILEREGNAGEKDDDDATAERPGAEYAVVAKYENGTGPRVVLEDGFMKYADAHAKMWFLKESGALANGCLLRVEVTRDGGKTWQEAK